MRGGARAGLGAHHERGGAERDAEDVLRALRELRAREERGGEVDAAVEMLEQCLTLLTAKPKRRRGPVPKGEQDDG